MTDTRYKIVFDGQLMPEMALDTVKDNLARLFKSDQSKIDALFSGSPVALKRDLAEAEADKYLAALRRAGALVRKEQEGGSLGLSLVDSEPTTIAPATPQMPANSMVCPKCGHQQTKAAECTACGIIIEKYLARQAQLVDSTPVPVAAGDQSPYSTPRSEVGEALEEYGDLKVFTTDGRIGRVRYLGWSMALMLLGLLAYGIAMGAMAISPVLGGILMIPVLIGAVVVSVMIGVQRLHDIGWSGWLWLLNFVPLVGSVFAILMLVIPGTQGANRYGPPPPPNSGGVIALAWSCLLVPIIGILAAISIPAYQDYVERAKEAQQFQQAPDLEE
ncbi:MULTISPECIES: DUF805 domain-containing protein [unclassified Pseudomonas]|uniref:DUF805 domain-containing protein n=1 Tax=unclassified Pseudomonas TaxID=196821 RepID=UPI00244CB4ED|nr:MULTISPECIES: DUF805 domain-containing protein [unclassified Pseudomonas]MDG9926081.1 DUF805 domain-containing protein [Pseudomonas sp. GD04045]MDH0034137.1 DUF805 domain-containing protein [Pseudomonas sp. GD04019]